MDFSFSSWWTMYDLNSKIKFQKLKLVYKKPFYHFYSKSGHSLIRPISFLSLSLYFRLNFFDHYGNIMLRSKLTIICQWSFYFNEFGINNSFSIISLANRQTQMEYGILIRINYFIILIFILANERPPYRQVVIS